VKDDAGGVDDRAQRWGSERIELIEYELFGFINEMGLIRVRRRGLADRYAHAVKHESGFGDDETVSTAVDALGDARAL